MIVSSRKIQAENTKRIIFQAAMKLLEKKDFEKITVRAIVREAGVSIGSFYNYYETKEQVFYETYTIADEYFENVVRHELTGKTARERIRKFFAAYSRYNSETTPLALVKVLYRPDNRCFHRSREYGMLPVLTGIVEEGLASGELKSSLSAEDITEFLMICIRGVVYDYCTIDATYELAPKVDSYVKLLLNAF